jgi:hypothetical protein
MSLASASALAPSFDAPSTRHECPESEPATLDRGALERSTSRLDYLRRARPFEHLSPGVRSEYLRDYGMHVRAHGYRVGCDAFEVRPDVEVGDAVETAAELLRGVIATLELLETDRDAPPPHREVCGACATLARQAGGALAIIAASIGTREDDRASSRNT